MFRASSAITVCTSHNTDVLRLFRMESLILLASRSADVFALVLTKQRSKLTDQVRCQGAITNLGTGQVCAPVHEPGFLAESELLRDRACCTLNYVCDLFGMRDV